MSYTISTSTNYIKLETLLVELYELIEFDSAMYVDELGYKWYQLDVVLDVLGIDPEEYISDIYLMEIMNGKFISEEGINVLLIDYDNEYQDNVKELLTSEVMPDIKSDMMYIADHLIDEMKDLCLKYELYVENEGIINKRVNKYTDKKMSRRRNDEKRSNKK